MIDILLLRDSPTENIDQSLESLKEIDNIYFFNNLNTEVSIKHPKLSILQSRSLSPMMPHDIFNKFLSITKSKYFGILSTNTVFYNNKIPLSIEYMEKNNNTAIVYSDFLLIDKQGQYQHIVEHPYNYRLLGSVLPNINNIFSTRIMQHLKFLPQWQQTLANLGLQFDLYHIPQELYRVRETNV